MRYARHQKILELINTHEIRNDEKGWQLIFDYDKIPEKK